eukprot:6505-Amphidinium_carterae.1
MKPVCKPYKLAKMVHKTNVERLKLKTDYDLPESDPKVRTMRTDLYAVNELIILPTTKSRE